MQEIKQAVIHFQKNEKYRELRYDGDKCYLIQDIPRGYIQKWVNNGHVIIEDPSKDLDVNEDVRSKDFIKSQYDAMINREEKLAKNLKLEREKKNQKAQVEKVEEKVEQVIEEEVESKEEENIEAKEESIEEKPEVEEKPKRRRRNQK
jgi:hypothetical protein